MRQISELLRKYFPFVPTAGQAEVFGHFEKFIAEPSPKKYPTFLLKGYAGTGKTTLISTLVEVLRSFKYKPYLLAPTGRAAKVMSAYARRKAFTIHKIIFKPEEDKANSRIRFVRQQNTHKNTIFIVDEASMIGHYNGTSNHSLLEELISFVFEDNTSGNKLILVGDTAQLPPVYQQLSPALDTDTLEALGLSLTETELQEVVRQQKTSGILANATSVRQQISTQKFALKIRTKGYKDIYKMTGEKLEDGLRYAYDKFGTENTCVVCRSNREATLFNKIIRQHIQQCENELDVGDVLMVVKNNYHWLPPDSPSGFLANGEFVQIQRINNVEEKYGFRFADLTLCMTDYPDQPTFEAKVHLDTLSSNTPALNKESEENLFTEVMQTHLPAENNENFSLQDLLENDEYLNALQIKFAYALTCHKAQGGQWDVVFVNMGYVKKEMYNTEWLRWLYTAFTRATKELYLVNFLPEFFAR